MPGHVVDLSQPGCALPRRIAVDSSLLIARWLAVPRPTLLHQAAQAGAFFRLVETSGAVGFVSSVVLQETLHVALATHFRLALPSFRSKLREALPRKRRFDWDDLYKVRPDLIPFFGPELASLRTFLIQHNLVVLQPADLSPPPGNHSLEDALLNAILRYQLDSNDAAILLDAQRAGITAVATIDADLRRAAPDFDVYTWL